MDRISIAANALIDAQNTSIPLKKFPSLSGPRTAEEAFSIQDAVLEKKDSEIAAWKVGPGLREMSITCAPIITSQVFQSPAKLPNSCRLKGIECEIAFRLAKDLPSNGTVFTRDDIKGAIKSVIVAIEAVETRFDSWPVNNPLWALADNQSNEALIVGDEIIFYGESQLNGLQGDLIIDQKELIADAGFPGGDPFALISDLANHISTRSSGLRTRGLKAGDIITTGSWNGVDFAISNSKIKVHFETLGSANLEYLS